MKLRVLLAGCAASIAVVLYLPASVAAAPVPLAQVGSAGTGAGQLTLPSAVALDGASNIYVAEGANNRISVFAPNGTFLRAFGWGVDTGASAFEVCTTASTCQAGLIGGNGGQLNNPAGITVDGAGNLYVVDFGNSRVSVFDTAGPSFTHAFGWDVANPNDAGEFEVCPTQGTCRPGDSGLGAGQLNLPIGVAVDGAGSLYVANQANNRIDVFSTAGPSFTRAFGWGVDTGAAAFETCTTASTCQQGLDGGGAGQLSSPLGVALDGAGGLYVSENGNSRISVFGTAGPSFTRAFGLDVADPDGNMAFEVCPTQGACRQGDPGNGAGELSSPFDVDLDGAGNLYVADFANERISVFGTAGPSFTHSFGWDVAIPDGNMAFEVCPIQGACQQGDPGAGTGQLEDPEGVATDCQGAVWVVETVNNRLQRFGEPGTGPCPATVPPAVPPAVPPVTSPSAVTGQRAAALKKCKKKKRGKARKKCKRKANRLPL